MRAYVSLDIRNVALAGHAHSGKTSLTSATLFAGGATSRLLLTEGGTTTKLDDEEIEWILPFESDTSLDIVGWPVADAILLAVDCAPGRQVRNEAVFALAEELHLPQFFVVTKLDQERACFDRVLHQIHERFGRHCVSIDSQAEVTAKSW